MKNILVSLLLAYLAFTSKAQSVKTDSQFISNELQKFRNHLDKKDVRMDAGTLSSLLHGNRKPLMIVDGANERRNKFEPEFTLPLKYYSCPAAKYPASQIRFADANKNLFSETDYDINGRPLLLYLKDEYAKTNDNIRKAKLLVWYISALNNSSPKQGDWDFAQSGLLWKYINAYDIVLTQLPRDTNKAQLFTDIADLMATLNPIYWRGRRLMYYLSAEKILINQRVNRTEKLHNSPEQPYQSYKDFILNEPNAVFLSNLYIQIYKTLTPVSWYDKNNSLLPLDSKRKYYINRAVLISRILDSARKIESKYVLNYEKELLQQTTTRFLRKDNRYSSSIFGEYKYILDQFISQVLTLGEADSLNAKKQVLYKSLGDIFYNMNDYEYAIKAYYKVVEYEIKAEKVLIEDLEKEDLMGTIFQAFYNSGVAGRPLFDKDIFIQFYQLYKSKASYYQNEPEFEEKNRWAREITNRAYALQLQGKISEAKEILLTARTTVIKDTTDESKSLQILYDQINNLGWLTEKKMCLTEIDRFDSVMYAGLNLPQETQFDGNPYIEEILAGWNQVENDAFWKFNLEELNDSIRAKQETIALKSSIITGKEKAIITLNTLNKELTGTNESLRDSIADKNTILKKLTGNIEVLAEKNTYLVNLVKKDSATLKATGEENKNLQNENKNLSSTNQVFRNAMYVLAPGAAVLFIVSIIFGFIIRKRRREIQKLDVLIKAREKEAEEKDLAKQLAEQQLLNETALGHDLISQIEHIPESIKDLKVVDSATSEFKEALNKSHQYAAAVYSYFHSNFNLRGVLLNSIEKEIEMAKEYASIWERIQDKRTGFVKINVPEYSDASLGQIEIPKHNLVNLISNAFRHGGIGKESILVSVCIRKTATVVEVVVEDDGTGFDEINVDNKKENRGLKLVLKQIENYNAVKKHPYTIDFGISNIENIFINGERKGARASYKLIKK